MIKLKITSLFFLIFSTLFLFYYNEKIIKNMEDLNNLENLIFQNGNFIENISSLEDYISRVATHKTIKNYEILNNQTSLLVSIESEKISTLLNILYNIESYSIYRIDELNINKKTLYEMNFSVKNL